jgi:hypothetical protein
MKRLYDTILELAKKLNPKQAFYLLALGIVCTTGYFIVDDITDTQVEIAKIKPSSPNNGISHVRYELKDYDIKQSSAVE